ncbi:SymE family type I addiction module toxin [Lonsdalea quercina]
MTAGPTPPSINLKGFWLAGSSFMNGMPVIITVERERIIKA